MAVLRDRGFERSKCQVQLHVHNHNITTHIDVVISFNIGYETLKQVKFTCNYNDFTETINTLIATTSAMLESSSIADLLNNVRHITGILSPTYNLYITPMNICNNEILFMCIITFDAGLVNSNHATQSGLGLLLTLTGNDILSFANEILFDLKNSKISRACLKTKYCIKSRYLS